MTLSNAGEDATKSKKMHHSCIPSGTKNGKATLENQFDGSYKTKHGIAM